MFSAFANPNQNPGTNQPPSSVFGVPAGSGKPSQPGQNQNQPTSNLATANVFAAPNPFVNHSVTSATFSAPSSNAALPAPTFQTPLNAQTKSQTNSLNSSGSSMFSASNPAPASNQVSNPPASIFSTAPQQSQSPKTPFGGFNTFGGLMANSSATSTFSTQTQASQQPMIGASIFGSQRSTSQGPSIGAPTFNFAKPSTTPVAPRTFGAADQGAAQLNGNSGSVFASIPKPKSSLAFDYGSSNQSSTPSTSFGAGSQKISSPWIVENDDKTETSSSPFIVDAPSQHTTATPSVFPNPTQASNGFSAFSSQPANGSSAFSASGSNAPSPFSSGQATSAPSAFNNVTTAAATTSPSSSSTFSSQQITPQTHNVFSAFAAPTGAKPSSTTGSNSASAFTQQSSNSSSIFAAPATPPATFATPPVPSANVFSAPAPSNRQRVQQAPVFKNQSNMRMSDADMGEVVTGYVEAWFSQVDECLRDKRNDDFGYLFPIGDQLDSDTQALRKELQRANWDELEERAENLRDDNKWPGLNHAVFGYLRYLKDLNDDLKLRFEATLTLAAKLRSAFAYNDAHPLNIPVKRTCTYLVNMAFYLDEITGDPEWKSTEKAHQRLRDIFNELMRTPKNPKELGKKLVIVHVTNLIFKIYMKTGQTAMLHTTQNSVAQCLGKDSPLASDTFPKSERCAYAYYIGRYHFVYGRFGEARNALQLAYDLAHIKAYSQRRLILVYLIACNIILGKFPSQRLFELPEAVGFADVFSDMIYAIKLGHFAKFEESLMKSRDWLIHYNIYYELRNCCQIMLWRSLVRNTHRVALKKKAEEEALSMQDGGMEQDPKKQRIENLLLDQILEAATIVNARVQDWPIGNRQMTTDRVEAALLSLLDQKVLRGYILRNSNGRHVLSAWSRKQSLFPKINEILA